MEEKKEDGAMIPCIVVPDGDDRETVLAALMLYSAHMTSQTIRANGVPGSALDYVIRETDIAVRLMRTLREQDATDAAQEVFRDTGTFSAFFRRITREFGDD